MSEKHRPAPAEQPPVAWARMKHGKIISVSHDKGVAEFVAGFAAHELVPLYVYQQPADAAQTARWLGWNADQKDLIREVFMRNGFKIKAGADDLADYVYAAAYELLQATPAVQMEVVGWQFYQDGKWWNGDDRIKIHRKNTEAAGIPVRDLYAVQQPAEQQPAPEVAMLVEALERAHMALIGYLPGHRNDITDAAISHCEQALAAHRKQGGEE